MNFFRQNSSSMTDHRDFMNFFISINILTTTCNAVQGPLISLQLIT